MVHYVEMISLAILVGTLARFYTLKSDYRNYPSYPHAYASHLTFGFIAAALGGVALPAILQKDFVAVTFLALAAQQFRDIRNIERTGLDNIEPTELVPRGTAYIEGIAKLFEARNYLAMVTSLVASFAIWKVNWWAGIIVGVLVTLLLNRFVQGPHVGDIAVIRVVPLHFDGPNIGIDEVIIMNVGEREALEVWKERGLGVVVEPKDDNARATLANIGQRQAILHDLAAQLGVYLDLGMQQFTPLARLDLDTGRVYIIIIPIEPDPGPIKLATERVPVLESSQRKPLQSLAGKKAAD
ncbi:MAG: YIEGIA family protein [Halanaerobium sp.]|nr:YIEGIA family protein [Halanaerobium sp.]